MGGTLDSPKASNYNGITKPNHTEHERLTP